ncbi:MAG TPA: ABC transporter ATP-binding protein [Herpetosiphonaceae bacterium]|nr:ABC transporter ATP-binding protein [Herpetosiphonaceae bacterium]
MFGGHGGGNWWSFVRFDEERDRPQINRRLLGRVATYARPYRSRIVLMLGAILVGSLLDLLPPLLLRDLIDNALPAGDRPGNLTRLNWIALGMIALPTLSGLIGVFQRSQSARVGEGIIFDLRGALYDHMQRMALRFFTNTKSGELVSRLNNDVVGAQRAVTGTLVSIITNFVMLVLTLGIMIRLEWRLALLSVMILPLFILPSRRVGRVLRRLTRRGMEANGQMNAMMGETLNVSGALLVKLFGRRHDEVGKFQERAAEVRDIGVEQAVIGRWFFLGIGLASAISTAMVFWVGGFLAIRGGFSTGTLVAFAAYLTQLYGPLSALVNARVELATSLVSFERVFEVLDLPLEVRETAAPVHLEEMRGRVEFDGVSFSYLEVPPDAAVSLSSRDRPVSAGPDETGPITPITSRHWALDDVSFSVMSGQMAALVGPSGSGKTTVTYLLPRLYDPTTGRICLDGHDLRELSLDTLARHIGMVTQETYLFHDTIAANLRYARTNATDEELIAACRAANIHDLIMQLPEGYNTVVGERGYRMSGGEKQRLAIARVILKNPRILVLDEATSALDSESERAIQDALETVMQGRTTLVIAHRLSTILKADTILVLHNGRLVEQGTHPELIRQGALYARLYATQFRDSEPAPAT